jgi:hypothetical protein
MTGLVNAVRSLPPDPVVVPEAVQAPAAGPVPDQVAGDLVAGGGAGVLRLPSGRLGGGPEHGAWGLRCGQMKHTHHSA